MATFGALLRTFTLLGIIALIAYFLGTTFKNIFPDLGLLIKVLGG